VLFVPMQETQKHAQDEAHQAQSASAQLLSTEERLAQVNAQVAKAQQQLSDLQEQIASTKQQQLSALNNTHLGHAYVQHQHQHPAHAGVLHTPGSGLLGHHDSLSPPPRDHRSLRASMQGTQPLLVHCLPA
jgi:TolA-binding protein